MPRIDPEGRARMLWNAYEQTTFCATVDGMTIRIKPGASDSCLDRILATRNVAAWAYITAWNPGSHRLSPQANDAGHEALKKDVASRGFEAVEGEGEPADLSWAPERSLLVFGIPADDAIAIGCRYGQNAIVIGEAGGAARLVRCLPDR